MRHDEVEARAAELAHEELYAYREQDVKRMRRKQRARAALYVEFGPGVSPEDHEAEHRRDLGRGQELRREREQQDVERWQEEQKRQQGAR